MYSSYKIWFQTVRKMCPITRRYHSFTTYMATFADRSFKVRARGELIILCEGADKKSLQGKKIREKDSEESDQILFRKRVKGEEKKKS